MRKIFLKIGSKLIRLLVKIKTKMFGLNKDNNRQVDGSGMFRIFKTIRDSILMLTQMFSRTRGTTDLTFGP